MTSKTQIEVGQINKERVRIWLLEHLGGKQTECAKDLGLSLMAINRHFAALRAEWNALGIK